MAPLKFLQHNAHFRDKGCRFEPPLTLFLTPSCTVGHVTVSRFFLVGAVECHDLLPSLPPTLSITTIAGPRYRKPKMASHDLRARPFEDGCLCSILHGPLQLQIWTAFLLPARLFPTAARQSATQLSHTTFSQLSEPTKGSSSTCTRFCSHFQLVSRLYIAALTYTSGLSSL